MTPSEACFRIIRTHQKLKLKAEFYYGRVDHWRVGYNFAEYIDGTSVKEGDTITEEEAESVLQHEVL